MNGKRAPSTGEGHWAFPCFPGEFMIPQNISPCMRFRMGSVPPPSGIQGMKKPPDTEERRPGKRRGELPGV
ncbi:hypothetical protein CXU22_00625 [Akkermansia muciniphila]|uniref:Uncharacterized protein n=1 Tax=Akkermansia muciniphila TaxID=239935 RepID=A0A2N8HGX6_9BACT|nr:hypothetical protein CXU22_00625 [Akkermansia muciniphila]